MIHLWLPLYLSLIEYRKMGIGSALMKEGFRIAERMDYTTAFLLGDPDYYRRFGYKLTQLYGIHHESFPAEYLMAKEIVPGALEGITGVIHM